jgi:hypothetical protein
MKVITEFRNKISNKGSENTKIPITKKSLLEFSKNTTTKLTLAHENNRDNFLCTFPMVTQNTQKQL